MLVLIYCVLWGGLIVAFSYSLVRSLVIFVVGDLCSLEVVLVWIS